MRNIVQHEKKKTSQYADIAITNNYTGASYIYSTKASANKIKTLKILIQTAQHLTYLGWTYASDFFSALYHPQLFHLGHLGGDRVQKKIRVRRFILSMLNVGLFESKF